MAGSRGWCALLAVEMTVVGAGHLLQGVRPGRALVAALILLLVAGTVAPIGYLTRVTLRIVRRLRDTATTYAELAAAQAQARLHRGITKRYEADLRASFATAGPPAPARATSPVGAAARPLPT